MRSIGVAFLLVILFSLPVPVSAQQVVWISAPANSEAVQGVVNIIGSSVATGFESANLSFAYSDNPTDTWFLIAALEDPVEAGFLAVWDTSTITDGEYTLRLQVFLADGTLLENDVSDVRVRNYTPIETAGPPPAAVASAQNLAPTQAASPRPVNQASTPLPANPLEVTTSQLEGSLLQGALAALIAFAGIGIYIALRAIGTKS